MTKFVVENTGKSLQVNIDGSGHKLKYSGTEYELKQFHFHAPSEHVIEQQRRGLEMHAVHSTEGENAQNAVVGFFWSAVAGAVADPFLQRIIDIGLPAEGTTLNHRCTKKEEPCLNIEALFPKAEMGQYVKYDGSLTTPPCTEAVTWFVELNLRTATVEQIQWFADHFKYEGTEGNYRAIDETKHPDLALEQLSISYPTSGKGGECGKGRGKLLKGANAEGAEDDEETSSGRNLRKPEASGRLARGA